MGERRYGSTYSYGGEWSALRLGRFIPKEANPNTEWLGGWVGRMAGLDDVPGIEPPFIRP
jgi:hypothetical protein